MKWSNDKVSLKVALALFVLCPLVLCVVLTLLYSTEYIHGILLIVLLPFCPPALIALLPEGGGEPGPLIFLTYAIYVFFLILFVRVRRRPAFYFVVGCYVVLLLLNIAGCAREESRKAYREQHWQDYK